MENKNKTKGTKGASTNSLSFSLRDLVEEVNQKEESFSENVSSDNDKVGSRPAKKGADIINDEVLFQKLEKINQEKKKGNALFTNIRIRKEFRNYLNQICFLEQFQDYTMGDIMEAVFNTYMEAYIESLKKQSLLRKSV